MTDSTTSYITAISFAFWQGVLSAEPLVTDRPDATESSSVVAPGFIQYEVGIKTTEDSDGEKGSEFGSSLLRVGLVEDWELRVGWDGYFDSEEVSGASDGVLGFKYFIVPEAEAGLLPEVALLVHTSLPIGDDELTSDQMDPDFLWAFSHTLNDRLSLGYILGVKLETKAKDNGKKATLASGLYSVALGYGATEQLGFYIEVFGDVAFSADESPVSLDWGMTWLFSEDTQLDLFAGLGLNDDADDWFVGLGYSIRWGY